MTRLRAAVILIVMTALPAIASPAYAWQEQGSYPDYHTCMQTGQDGVDRGDWISYYCKWVWGDYILWVA